MSNIVGNRSNGHPKWVRITPRGTWAHRAACIGTDPDTFFLDDQTGTYREARQICAACQVRPECLDWALETNTAHGLFGGLAPKERKRLRRRFRVQAGHLGGLDHLLYLIILFLFILVLLRALRLV